MGVAKNKLGELFVDIGLGGVAKTIKGLNAVSASFLLVKTAATQLVKPILNTTKSISNNATEIKKMSLSLGTSVTQVQKMSMWLKQHSISDSILSNISSLMEMYKKIELHQGTFTDEFIWGMKSLNLNVQDYNSSLESQLQLLQDITDQSRKMQNGAEANLQIGRTGYNAQDILYARESGVNWTQLPSQANMLSDDEINNAIKTQEDLLKLQQDVFNAMSRIFVANEEPIRKIINGLDKLLSTNNTNKMIDFTLSKAFKLITFSSPGTFLFARMIDELYKQDLNRSDLPSPSNNYALPPLPNISSSNITINQNIHSIDPLQAGNESKEKLASAMSDMQQRVYNPVV